MANEINLFIECMHIAVTLFLLFLCLGAESQKCLSNDGKPVHWWIQLIFPGSVAKGYAYFDSTFAAPAFTTHQNAADSSLTAMTRTLTQINNRSLQTIAWNDQMPNGSISSTKAHAKGVVAFNESSNIGFFIDHSIPSFPAFKGSVVNTTINKDQTIYGQHVFCLSLDSTIIGDLIARILPTKPNTYASNLKSTNSLNNLLASGTIKQPDYTSLFAYKNYTVNKTQMAFIFKNGNLNGSIFEGGMNEMLKSPLLAETWGRPLQPPWCGNPYPVGNINSLKISSKVSWKVTQDHSKWAYATLNNYACFGDMNRMYSQWKRGGAFYCINSSLLKLAFVAITNQKSVC